MDPDNVAKGDASQPIVENGTQICLEVKYAENLKIGTLNINSLSAPGKFEGLEAILSQGIDILVVNETKLDDSFPTAHFIVDGFTPYRRDRNRNGGGVIIYVRQDIPSKELTKFKLADSDKNGSLEWIFLEVRLKDSKWLFMVRPLLGKIDFQRRGLETAMLIARKPVLNYRLTCAHCL